MKKPLKEVILVILKDKYHSQICVFCQALVEEYQPLFFKRKGFKFTKWAINNFELQNIWNWLLRAPCLSLCFKY